MGYLRPTAIIVSASYSRQPEAVEFDGPASAGLGNDARHWTEIAHDKALEIFSRPVDVSGQSDNFAQLVSPIVPGVTNSVRSFFVAWDGSKEGWRPSDVADERRAEFVAWLRDCSYSDHSSPLDWVELQYGGDDKEVIALADDGEHYRVEMPA